MFYGAVYGVAPELESMPRYSFGEAVGVGYVLAFVGLNAVPWGVVGFYSFNKCVVDIL